MITQHHKRTNLYQLAMYETIPFGFPHSARTKSIYDGCVLSYNTV